MVSDKLLAESISTQLGSGYWKVGDRYFFNKAECLRYATSINDFNVTFHYHDEFYNSLQWHTEPSESLEELYRRRAQQLRDKYDYIILSFSGGSDSYNVLDTFLKNGIHIDCIATSYPVQAIEKLKSTFNPNDTSANNAIFEFTEVALPKLKEVAKLSPKTEIAILDHTNTAIDMILANKLHTMPVGGVGASPGLAGHYMIGEKVREYNEKGKAVYLTGVDKPKIAYNTKNKKFGTYFDDVSLVLGNWNKDAYSGYNPNVEHFYYTTEMPELWQKQLHILKRAVMPIIQMAEEDRPDFFKKLTMKTVNNNYMFYVHDIFFKKLIYNTWSENFFQAGKPSGFFFQEHSNWFLKGDLTDKRSKDYHYGQVMEILNGIDPKFIIHDSNGKPLQFNYLQTKPIAIG